MELVADGRLTDFACQLILGWGFVTTIALAVKIKVDDRRTVARRSAE